MRFVAQGLDLWTRQPPNPQTPKPPPPGDLQCSQQLSLVLPTCADSRSTPQIPRLHCSWFLVCWFSPHVSALVFLSHSMAPDLSPKVQDLSNPSLRLVHYSAHYATMLCGFASSWPSSDMRRWTSPPPKKKVSASRGCMWSVLGLGGFGVGSKPGQKKKWAFSWRVEFLPEGGGAVCVARLCWRFVSRVSLVDDLVREVRRSQKKHLRKSLPVRQPVKNGTL